MKKCKSSQKISEIHDGQNINEETTNNEETSTIDIKSFDITSQQYHTAIHINALRIKDHKCQLCEKYFVQKSILKTHKKNVNQTKNHLWYAKVKISTKKQQLI